MKPKVVIVGASITGFYVMDELIKKNFAGEITLIDKKDVYPYNPYPLSKEWLLDENETEPPLLQEKEFYEENNVDLRLNTEVRSIDASAQTVTTQHAEVIPYDHLVIATGSKLRKIKLPGDDAHGVFYLRAFAEAETIKQWAKDVENVAIIGAGFMGLELASTFSQAGKNVSVLVHSGRPLEKILGAQVSDHVVNMHQSHHVNFLFGEDTAKINKDEQGKVTSLLTTSGKTVQAEMVLISVGVEPELSFEIEGLEIDRAIVVNAYGETSLPNVYAGGDNALWPYQGHLIHVEHWETAWSQGVSIARNIIEARSNAYKVVPYFWTDQYDQTFEYLGNARTWDKTFVRGSLEERGFAVAYVDENKYPLAILFANKFAKRKDIRALLTRNEPLDEKKFSDVNIPLEEM